MSTLYKLKKSKKVASIVKSLMVWAVIIAMLLEGPLAVAAQAYNFGGEVVGPTQALDNGLPDQNLSPYNEWVNELADVPAPGPDVRHLEAALSEAEEEHRVLQDARTHLIASIAVQNQSIYTQRAFNRDVSAQYISLYAAMLEEENNIGDDSIARFAGVAAQYEMAAMVNRVNEIQYTEMLLSLEILEARLAEINLQL